MNKKIERKIKRGDIYLYDYGENERSIQNGYRPVVVLQADNFNRKAPTIMVAAITTAIKKTIKWYLENREWWEEIISGEYQNYYEKMYANR